MIWSRLLPFGIVSAALVCCFWEALFFDTSFAFRDAAHFYYPLFKHVQGEWSAGRIPLWNPYENSGEPLLANSTSSVFYPGQLLFFLPIGYAWAYKLYTVSHVLLAACTAYFLARRWGTSVLAATICTISYAFCGQILFQYLNVVFLCAAAWLPLAVWAADAMLRKRRFAYAALLGLTLALMVLGGDPQLAYEAGLLAALAAVLYWRHDRRVAAKKRATPTSWRQSRPALLAFTAATMACLAAVQLLPTSELSKMSDRGYFDAPRNLYEIPEWLGRDYRLTQRYDGTPARWYDSMIGKPPEPSSHQGSIYNFSLPPWRLVEFVWPYVTGRPLPQYRRWYSAATGEGRFWTPTLYMGLLPLVLAAGAWRLSRAEPRTAWLSWMVVIGVIASFGSYGLGWLWFKATGNEPVGHEVGGLYWLLTVLLPGFVQFRFPAKLMTLTALGLSVLAALGWQQLEQGQTARTRRVLVVLAGLSVVALLVVAAVAPFWRDWFAGHEDKFFGPLDVDGAYWDLAASLAHTLILSVLLIACLGPLRWRKSVADDEPRSILTNNRGWRLPAVVLITAAEICLANYWMIVVAPVSAWTAPSRGAKLLHEAETQRNDALSGADRPRMLRMEMVAPHFQNTPSSARPQESIQWDRDTLKPKYGLLEGVSNVRVQGTIQLYDYQLFLAPNVFNNPPRIIQPRRAYDALGVKYFILPKESDFDIPGLWIESLQHRWHERPPEDQGPPPLSPQGERLPPAVADPARWLGPLDRQIDLLYNDSAFPRAWIVHDIFVTPHIDSADRLKLMSMMATMVSPEKYVIDMRQAAWVDNDTLDRLTPSGRLLNPPADAAAESCRITDYQPQRVELEVGLTSPGLVVLSDLYYPGWQLSVTAAGRTQELPIIRTNRVMRGALLPAGQFKLVYEYRPASFYLGAAISLATWIAAIIAAIVLAIRSRSPAR